MAQTRLFQEEHRVFLTQMVAAFSKSPTKLTRMLADPEIAAANNFNPITISQSRVQAIVRDKLDGNEIAKCRARFLMDMGELPLSYSKMRIEELSDMYWKVDDMIAGGTGKPLSNGAKMNWKLRIMREIRQETGGDMETMIKTLMAAGRTVNNYTFNFGDLSEDQRMGIRQSIAAVYNNNGSDGAGADGS